jgi:hypothetical protein
MNRRFEVQHVAERRAPRRRLAAPGSLLALLVLTAFAACTRLEAGNVLPDAGSHSTPSGACAHAEPPDPPARSRASSASPEHDYVFASSAYDVGDTNDSSGNPRYMVLGYDLDHTCTGGGQGASCKLPPWQTTAVTDGPGGRDNSVNQVFFLATSAFGAMVADKVDAGQHSTLLSFDSNVDAQSGSTTVVLRIRGYNGEADDPKVTLDMFSGTLWPDRTGGPKPTWSHDRWHATSPWLKDGALDNDSPRFSDNDAYVHGGVLVAHLDSLLVGNAFAPAGTWRKVLITGRLSRATPEVDDDAFELHDVALTGRWPIGELLSFVARSQDPSTGALECTGRPFYEATRPIYCQNVDLSALRDDGSAACDAISIVFDIDMVPTTLGEPIAIELPSWPKCAALGCDGKPLPAQPQL